MPFGSEALIISVKGFTGCLCRSVPIQSSHAASSRKSTGQMSGRRGLLIRPIMAREKSVQGEGLFRLCFAMIPGMNRPNFHSHLLKITQNLSQFKILWSRNWSRLSKVRSHKIPGPPTGPFAWRTTPARFYFRHAHCSDVDVGVIKSI